MSSNFPGPGTTPYGRRSPQRLPDAFASVLVRLNHVVPKKEIFSLQFHDGKQNFTLAEVLQMKTLS